MRMAFGITTIALSLTSSYALSAGGQGPTPTPSATLLDAVTATLSAQSSEFIELRHDLHRHPEISGSEERTARVVAQRMKALGLDVRTGVGGHGVVATLKGGRPGRVIAYRADMDAVSSNDPDPVDFASIIPGVRHQCGHDVHTTIAVALATAFSAVRAEMPGSIMFIFQPAEETATGARAMLADGVFSKLKPAEIYGLHTGPGEVGRLGTRQGVLLAARDRLRITIAGTGDKQLAETAARSAAMSISTITEAQATQLAPADVSFVQMGASRRDDTGITIHAAVTVGNESARERSRQALTQRLTAIAVPDVIVKHEYEPRAVAGVTNDPSLTAAAVSTLANVESVAVQQIPGVAPAFSEDFGSFQDEVPGVFFFLGVSNAQKGYIGLPHSPSYVADDGAILVGSRAMAAVLLARVAQP